MYILDTDLLIELSRGRSTIQERIVGIGMSNCSVSEVSLAELYVGFYKNQSVNRYQFLLTFLEESLLVVPISSAIKTYARIRSQLELQGNRLDNMDLFIAATALANDYTLVTHNTRHFSRIPGLKLEDWIEE